MTGHCLRFGLILFLLGFKIGTFPRRRAMRQRVAGGAPTQEGE